MSEKIELKQAQAVIARLKERAEKAEAAVARVEALVDEWRDKRDQSITAAEARRGLRDENDLRFHAYIMSKRLRELSAALRGVTREPSESKGHVR